MVKVTLSADNLKQLVDILNIYDVDAPIIFEENEVTVKIIDITRTALVVAKIEKDVFTEYDLGDIEQEIICLPKDKLGSILKAMKGNVTIETKDGWIEFSSGKSSFKLRNVGYDENLLKLDLKLEYENSFDMTPEQFKYVFDITSIFDQYTIIEYKDKGVSFKSASDIEGSASITYSEAELNNVEGDGEATSAFSSSYFKGIMKLKPMRFILSVAEDRPIRVVAPLMEGKCKCTVIVAPVILDE